MILILLGTKDRRMLQECVQRLKSSLRSYLIHVNDAAHNFEVDRLRLSETVRGVT